MIDHIGIRVVDLAKSKEFYRQALAPLGYDVLREGEGYCGIGPADDEEKWAGTVWLSQGESGTPIHIALRAKGRKDVDAFYRAAMTIGAIDNGAPGLRPEYHENYYGAFVHDFDGNNLEAVCHLAE